MDSDRDRKPGFHPQEGAVGVEYLGVGRLADVCAVLSRPRHFDRNGLMEPLTPPPFRL